MLFASKNGSAVRNKTPSKNNNYLSPAPKGTKKEGNKMESGMKQKGKNEPLRYRTKESFLILQGLEDIYNELSFNDFDIFPIENIDRARKNIQNLLGFLGAEPICRYHQDLLNLYCEHQKSVICVSCVYKTAEHKGHKIKSLESVGKVLELETIRCQQKTRGYVHQLGQLKEQIDFMTKQIGENYMMISKYTLSVIDESIKELNSLKNEMEKKLSLAYRRTTTVINRYSDALDMIINHLDNHMQKTVVMNPLSKHILLKELTSENQLIDSLVGKFQENRQLMQQWGRSNKEFEKIVLKKRTSINQKVDSFVVTEF